MPEAPLVELTIVHGPLPDSELAGIARTYGKIDERYLSLEFCRILFNENPFGFAFHAFVHDGEKLVGHNAVIPIRVRARGLLVISGKGEALYLEPEYRSAVVESEKGPIPAGIALMMRLYDHALANGVEVIHNITSPEVGSIQLRTGFKRIDLQRRQRHYLLDPTSFPLLARSKSRLLAGRLLSAAQKCARWTLGAVLRLSGAPAVRVNPPDLTLQIMVELARRDEEARPSWAISRDVDTLRWQARLDRIDILVPEGAEGCYAVLTKGSSRELVQWNVPPGSWRVGLAVWHEVLARSEHDHAAVVSLSQSLLEKSPVLRWGALLLGLFPKDLPASLYIKSTNPYYKDVGNIAFDRMFNLI